MSNRSFKVLVDYAEALVELTERGQNAWTNQVLNGTVLPRSQTGRRVIDFELVLLDEEVVGLPALTDLLTLDGLRLATASELRGFATHYLLVNRPAETIHALGSAFFNEPDEYPEETGWFAEQLKIFADGSHDFQLESVLARSGRLKWPVGTTILAVRE
ncbi:MAG: hypothetical protein V1738_02265 [Patescibacteria group bacterium]